MVQTELRLWPGDEHRSTDWDKTNDTRSHLRTTYGINWGEAIQQTSPAYHVVMTDRFLLSFARLSGG